jgi:hypothetical protein
VRQSLPAEISVHDLAPRTQKTQTKNFAFLMRFTLTGSRRKRRIVFARLTPSFDIKPS